MLRFEASPVEAFASDPITVAAGLEMAYVETLYDPGLPKKAREEIARRTLDALIDHMERHPELQQEQSTDTFSMRFNQ